MQKYAIHEDGQVYYQCRFLRTKSFKSNLEANGICRNEFATNACNDNRLISKTEKQQQQKQPETSKKQIGLRQKLSLDNLMSDNAMISIYPLGKKYFCFYESPFILQVDPVSLSTLDRVDLNKKLSIFSHASHPHYDSNGDMLTLATKVGLFGPEYVIHKFAKEAKDTLSGGQAVARVRARWLMEPGYMHSFAVTENYYILIEQPLTVHAPTLASGESIIY